MKIAIVDDCLADGELLAGFIARYCAESHLRLETELFAGGECFLLEMHKTEAMVYDLVFLDIYMGGIDGMETARHIHAAHPDCLLVFVTSSLEHAVESYRVRAFDYLPKPYDYAQLRQILQECDKALLQQMRFIEVKEGRIFVKILLRDILYTDYFNHYIQIHTVSRTIHSYMPFAEFSELLLPYPQFLCCYRNCIVNMDAVTAMDDKDFVVRGGTRVPMARAQRAELRQHYADYAFRHLEENR